MVIQYEIATFDLLSPDAPMGREGSLSTPQGMETALRLATVAEEAVTPLRHTLPADIAVLPVDHFLGLMS